MMRTISCLITSMFALGLTACPGNEGETTGTTDTPQTTGSPTTADMTTTGTTAEPTTAEPTTVEPTTVEPTTVEPTTADPGTTTEDTAATLDTLDTLGTTGDPVDPTCEAYCGVYMQGCKDFKEYDNQQACLEQCSQWPPGTPGDVDGDSLACRTYHVTVASMQDPDVHCPHAGPSGAGVCVAADAPSCGDYCQVYNSNCKGDLNLYTDMNDCLDQCAGWYPGKPADTVGDTVGCRLYHAGVAMGEPDVHCPHAGPGGADVCVVQ